MTYLEKPTNSLTAYKAISQLNLIPELRVFFCFNKLRADCEGRSRRKSEIFIYTPSKTCLPQRNAI